MTTATAEKTYSVEPVLLLLSHLTCIDGQIHNREMSVLRELGEEWSVSDATIEQMEAIFSQAQSAPAARNLLNEVSVDHQGVAIRSMLALAYADGHFCKEEQDFVNSVAGEWGVSEAQLQKLRREAEGLYDQAREDEEADSAQEVSFAARLLGGVDKIFTPKVVDLFVSLGPSTAKRKVERLRNRMLLAGPEYDDAVTHCAEIGERDFDVASTAMARAHNELVHLSKNVDEHIEQIKARSGEGRGQSAAMVAEQLEQIKNSIDDELLAKVRRLRTALRSKRRATDSFTIAFMGKTKVGKSTLHAVITGEGWDAIGVGRQRTTRYNRVYEWKNIRIIDTPGIGAPGGRTDEEIAESIVDEADVICYVVTNDSQQESEFEFLRRLKDRTKPLIILLNVKKNLSHPKRLERFLARPERVFKMRGSNSLEGHIDRIRRYAEQHYANNYFDIVPVQLLAAQLSRQEEYEADSEVLYEASRLPDFLDSLRVSLVEEGVIRRSQTFLGSTARDIEDTCDWLERERRQLTVMSDTLAEKRSELKSRLKTAARDTLNTVSVDVEGVYNELENSITSFANKHWDVSEDKELRRLWERHVKSMRVNQRIKDTIEGASEEYAIRIREALQEIGRDIELGLKLGAFNAELFAQDTGTFMKRVLTIGGALAGSASALLALFGLVSNPVGWAIAAGGLFVGLLGGFAFDSKTKKQRKAVAKITEALQEQVAKSKSEVSEKFGSKFTEQHSEVAGQLDSYFGGLSQGLATLGNAFEDSRDQVDVRAQELNAAYALRIVDWACEDGEQGSAVVDVARECGLHMKITLDAEPKLKRSTEELSRILQEDVEFTVMNAEL